VFSRQNWVSATPRVRLWLGTQSRFGLRFGLQSRGSEMAVATRAIPRATIDSLQGDSLSFGLFCSGLVEQV
jgi:hypothetical protein